MKKVYKQPVVRCIEFDSREMLMQGSIIKDGDSAYTNGVDEDALLDTEFDTRRQNTWNEW